MNTAVINIKVEPLIKKKAQKTADALGLSLSAIINGFLRQFIETKTITFREPEEPNDYFIEMLKESQEDVKKGHVISFANPSKAIKYVDELIENDEKHK